MDVFIFHTPHTPQTLFEPHKPPQTPFEPHKPCQNAHKPRLNPADVLKPHRHFKPRIYPATTQHNGRSGLRRDSDGRQAGFGPIPHHGFPVARIIFFQVHGMVRIVEVLRFMILCTMELGAEPCRLKARGGIIF